MVNSDDITIDQFTHYSMWSPSLGDSSLSTEAGVPASRNASCLPGFGPIRCAEFAQKTKLSEH